MVLLLLLLILVKVNYFFDRMEEIESEIDDIDNFGLNFTLSGITLSNINGGNSFLNRTAKVETYTFLNWKKQKTVLKFITFTIVSRRF